MGREEKEKSREEGERRWREGCGPSCGPPPTQKFWRGTPMLSECSAHICQDYTWQRISQKQKLEWRTWKQCIAFFIWCTYIHTHTRNWKSCVCDWNKLLSHRKLIVTVTKQKLSTTPLHSAQATVPSICHINHTKINFKTCHITLQEYKMRKNKTAYDDEISHNK